MISSKSHSQKKSICENYYEFGMSDAQRIIKLNTGTWKGIYDDIVSKHLWWWKKSLRFWKVRHKEQIKANNFSSLSTLNQTRVFLKKKKKNQLIIIKRLSFLLLLQKKESIEPKSVSPSEKIWTCLANESSVLEREWETNEVQWTVALWKG